MPEFTMFNVKSHLESISDRLRLLDLALSGAEPCMSDDAYRGLSYLVDDLNGAVFSLTEMVKDARAATAKEEVEGEP